MLVENTEIEVILVVDNAGTMRFSLLGEGTKVSMHFLGTLFVFIV